jgi:hypothetical protein
MTERKHSSRKILKSKLVKNKCHMKTCKSKKYQSLYGRWLGGKSRSIQPLFL